MAYGTKQVAEMGIAEIATALGLKHPALHRAQKLQENEKKKAEGIWTRGVPLHKGTGRTTGAALRAVQYLAKHPDKPILVASRSAEATEKLRDLVVKWYGDLTEENPEDHITTLTVHSPDFPQAAKAMAVFRDCRLSRTP